MPSALQHLQYTSTWFLGRSERKQMDKDVINYLAMCIRRVLVLPVKKQEDCLTIVSFLHKTVSIISGNKRNKLKEGTYWQTKHQWPLRVFPVSGWTNSLSRWKIVWILAVCCSQVLTVRAWNWNENANWKLLRMYLVVSIGHGLQHLIVVRHRLSRWWQWRWSPIIARIVADHSGDALACGTTSREVICSLAFDAWDLQGNGAGSQFSLVVCFKIALTWANGLSGPTQSLSGNCGGWCMHTRRSVSVVRVGTWGEWNSFICIIRRDDLGCILQCAIRSNSITEIRGDRRHDTLVNRWFQWGEFSRSKTHTIFICFHWPEFSHVP